MALVGGASTAEGMPSNASKCTGPGALAVNSQRMCFACTGESNVRCMDFSGANPWLVYTRAGRPSATSGKGLPRGMEYEGATATSIRLADVAGLAFDPEGNLVISDNEASLIYKVRLD